MAESSSRKATFWIAATLILAALWVVIGEITKQEMLSRLHHDYLAAKLARKTPALTTVAMGGPDRRFSDFANTYEDLESSNLLTALWHATRLKLAHNRL